MVISVCLSGVYMIISSHFFLFWCVKIGKLLFLNAFFHHQIQAEIICCCSN